MKPEKLYILGPRSKGDEATEKWKKETEKLVSEFIYLTIHLILLVRSIILYER